jgi:hypothetical protein
MEIIFGKITKVIPPLVSICQVAEKEIAEVGIPKGLLPFVIGQKKGEGNNLLHPLLTGNITRLLLVALGLHSQNNLIYESY